MKRITRAFLVCALVGVMLAGLVSHYDEHPQTVTVTEPGIYVEVPALGTDTPASGYVVYVGTEEQRRHQAIKNIQAEV